jgi:hypothetical protein
MILKKSRFQFAMRNGNAKGQTVVGFDAIYLREVFVFLDLVTVL